MQGDHRRAELRRRCIRPASEGVVEHHSLVVLRHDREPCPEEVRRRLCFAAVCGGRSRSSTGFRAGAILSLLSLLSLTVSTDGVLVASDGIGSDALRGCRQSAAAVALG